MRGTGVFYIILGLLILLLFLYASKQQRRHGGQADRSAEDLRNEHYMDLRSFRDHGDRRDDSRPT